MNDLEKKHEFIMYRDSLKNYLTKKGLLQELEILTNCSRTTVYLTFKVESESALTGDKWRVWNAAIELVDKIKTTMDRTKEVLEK